MNMKRIETGSRPKIRGAEKKRKKNLAQKSKGNVGAVADVMELMWTELTEKQNKRNAFLSSSKTTVIYTRLKAPRGITSLSRVRWRTSPHELTRLDTSIALVSQMFTTQGSCLSEYYTSEATAQDSKQRIKQGQSQRFKSSIHVVYWRKG
jgi:hypothetical protein